MRYERVNGVTHIYVAEDESEITALVTIAQASFALARPFLETWKYFDFRTCYDALSDEAAREYLGWEEIDGMIRVLEMDEVKGRKCATTVYRVEKRHFILDNAFFEPYRGSANSMLDFARYVLENGPISGLFSTDESFSGESLTLRLEALGFPRKENEDDWGLRKRAFPHLYERHRKLGWEFLLGRSYVEWDDWDAQYCFGATFFHDEETDRLVKFGPVVLAAGFVSDPAVLRGERARKYVVQEY